MRKFAFLIILFWGGVISGVHAEGSSESTPASDLAATLQDAGRRGSEGMPSELTLALQVAMRKNVSLNLAMMDLQAIESEVSGESFYMEPDVVLRGSYEKGNRQNTVEQSVSLLSDTFEWKNTHYSAALEGLLPIGTTYRLGYDYADLANNLTSRTFRDPFESEYTGYAGISVTQPLLKNFGPTATRQNLLHARLRRDVAEQNLRKQKMLTVANTVLAYSAVWMQQELVRVRLSSLDNARTLLEDSEKRRLEGKIAAIEMEAIRGGVVERETQWLYANTQWRNALNELANLLSVRVGSEPIKLQPLELELLDASELEAANQFDDLAVRHPDILIKQREIESSALQVKVMKNQRLPELNLEGNYGLSRLGDNSRDSYVEYDDGEFYSWSIGMVLRVGLMGGQKDKYLLRKARVGLERSQIAYAYVETELGNRLRTSLQKVSLIGDTVVREMDTVKINDRALEAEKQLLSAGKSKPILLLEMEEDLLEAQEDLIEVQTLYRRSVVELQLANARILEEYGFE